MSFWNPERIALLNEVWAKSSHAELVAHFPGATYNAIRKKAHRLGLPHRNVVIGALGLPVDTLPAEPVAEAFDVQGAIKELKKRGIEIEKRPTITDKVFDLSGGRRFAGDLVRIGIVSDTHLCSKYQQLTHLHACYQRFADEGVTMVLHAGDLVEGIRMYRGWEQSVLEHGADGQIAYAVKHYPRQPGITTYVISGNHDDSFRSNAGVNVVKRVCALREDMEYLGDHGAYIDLPGGMRAYLHHGMGGSAYSRCVPGDTEILTESGWQRFDELTRGIRVATLNPDNHHFEWQAPTDYCEFDHDGELLHFKTRTYDLHVTPEHRMLARRYPGYVNRRDPATLSMPQKSHQRVDTGWNLIPARELDEDPKFWPQKWQMRQSVEGFEGTPLSLVDIPGFGQIKIEDAIDLAGWYVTEGFSSKCGKIFCIFQSPRVNADNWEEIRTLMVDRLGLKLVNSKRPDCFQVSKAAVARWLAREFGRVSHEKRLPRWIKELPTSHLKRLLQVMIKGDGWILGRSYGYRSVSQRLCDDVQEVCLKSGWGASIRQEAWKGFNGKPNLDGRTSRGATVCIRTIQNYPTINKRPERVPFTGKVYCVSVPNETILLRHNGKILWTGNSYKIQKAVENFAPEAKPHLYIVGHYHITVTLPDYRNVFAMHPGCFQAQSDFLRRLGVSPDVGGWILEYRVNPETETFDLSEISAKWIPFRKSIPNDY